MATTLAELKRYIKRSLGDPVTNIEIADSQMDDRIQEAFDHFKEFHSDGTDEAVYTLATVTDQTVYTLPDQIESVIWVYPDSDFLADGDAFQVPVYWSRYGWPAQGGLGAFAEVNVADMAFIRQQISLVGKQFEKSPLFDFNPTTKRFALYETPTVDSFIGLKVFQSDTDATKLYSNKWFKKYCIALCGIQWAVNVGKYTGVSLPGGASINGDVLETRYNALKEQVEDELQVYIEPPDIFVG